MDEYEIFKTSVSKFKAQQVETFNLWQFSLGDKEKEVLNDIISTKRVEINEKNIESVPRKIVKIRRMGEGPSD